MFLTRKGGYYAKYFHTDNSFSLFYSRYKIMGIFYVGGLNNHLTQLCGLLAPSQNTLLLYVIRNFLLKQGGRNEFG